MTKLVWFIFLKVPNNYDQAGMKISKVPNTITEMVWKF